MSGSTIDFHYYPSSNRVHGVFAEVDPSKANTGSINQRALIIGQYRSGFVSSTVVANQAVISAGGFQAGLLYGTGSMLARMVNAYRGIDAFGEVDVLPMADDASSIVATGTITLAGPAITAGTLSAYIGGQLVAIAVNPGDSVTVIGNNLTSQINLQNTLPVVASNGSAGVVILTAKNAGLVGNNIDIRFNYQGAAGGEVFPNGVNAVVTQAMQNGSGTQTQLAVALANLADTPYDFIIHPYTDTNSLNTVQAFLNDSSGRWSWQSELFGHAFSAFVGSQVQASTFGNARNDQHQTVLAYQGSPSMPDEVAAIVGAATAVSVRADPGQPLQEVALTGMLAPPIGQRFNIGTRNTLLYDGISTYFVDNGGVCRIDRLITNYQFDPSGAPDNSYLDVETMYSLMWLVRDMRGFLQSNFARKKLVNNGSRIPAGSNMVTANIVLAAVISRYRANANAGYCQNPDIFAQNAVANNAGGGLLKLLLPFDLVNQLRQIAMLVQFVKS